MLADNGETTYRLAELGQDDELVQAVEPETGLEQALLRSSSPRFLVCQGGGIEGIDRLASAFVVAGGLRVKLIVDGFAPQGPMQRDEWSDGVLVADDLALECTTSGGAALRLPLDFIVGQGPADLPPIMTRRSASIAAIMKEAAPNEHEWDGAAEAATRLRRRLTLAMRSSAQTIAEVIRDAVFDAGLSGFDAELVSISTDKNEKKDLTELTVTMSDGSSATLELDPDATIWSD